MPAYVPKSYREFVSNGSAVTIPVPFPYLRRSHVGVYLDMQVEADTYSIQLVEGSGYIWANDTTIVLTPALPNGQAYTVRRFTPSSQLAVVFADGSNLIASDLNTAALQNLYVTQEVEDKATKSVEKTITLIDGSTSAYGFERVANVASLPPSPTAGKLVEVVDTTGIAAVALVTGEPPGFVGSAALSARLRWSGAAWVWVDYHPTDPDGRYLSISTNLAGLAYGFERLANVGALPSSPAEGKLVEVVNTTGIESVALVTGEPSGFVGSPALSARLRWMGGTWAWLDYRPSDPDARYLSATSAVTLSSIASSFASPAISNLAAADFEIPVGELATLTAVTLSHPSWLRLYRSPAQRASDTRLAPGGTLQSMIDLGDSRPYAEFATTETPQTIFCNPVPMLRGDNTSPAGLAYARLVNRSGASRSITGAITTNRIEA